MDVRLSKRNYHCHYYVYEHLTIYWQSQRRTAAGRNQHHSTALLIRPARRLNEVKSSAAVTQMTLTSQCRLGTPTANMCFRQIALRTIELHNYVECHQWGVNLSVARRQTLELIDLRGFKNKLLKAAQGGSAYLSLTMCLSEHPNLYIQVAELLLPMLWESGSSPPISKCYFWKNQQDCVSRNNDPLHQINPHSLLTAVHWRDCCLSQYEMCIKLMEGVVLSSRKYSFTTSLMTL